MDKSINKHLREVLEMKYDLKRFKNLYEMGATRSSLEAEFKVLPITIDRRILALGLKPRGVDFLKGRVGRLKELLGAGYHLQTISKELMVPLSSLTFFMKEEGLEKTKRVTEARRARVAQAVELRGKNMTLRDIGSVMGMTMEGVRLLLLDGGMSGRIGCHKEGVRKKREQFIKRYKMDLWEGLAYGKTLTQIAKELGLSRSQITKLSKEVGGSEMMDIAKELKFEYLSKLYQEGLSVQQIADMYEMNAMGLYVFLRRRGNKFRKAGGRRGKRTQ